MPRNSTTHSKRREEKGGLLASIGGRWRNWLLAVLLIGAVVVAALHWGDVKKFAALTAKAEPAWLAVAFLLQVGTYVSLSLEWWLVLRAGGKRAKLVKLLPITIVKLFADQVIPTAGVSGNVLLVQRLTAIGGGREVAVAAVILAIVAYYASFALAAVAALVLLWLNDGASWFVIAVVAVFLCVAAAIPTGALVLQRKGRKALPRWLGWSSSAKELLELVGDAPAKLVRNRRLIGELTLLNAAVFVLDALTLQACLLAIGVTAPFDAAFVPLIMASIIVVLGPIPLGLGSFEATSIAMLRAMGVSFEAAISATLLYRGFALWLPLLLGTALVRRTLKPTRHSH